ncbi:MAG: hypothetical protein AB7O98_14675 [Hyphomonadaceae bacterium]
MKDVLRVRWMSRAAAALIAAAALYLAAAIRADAPDGFSGGSAASIAVVVEYVEPERPIVLETRPARATSAAASPANDGEFAMPLLWINAPDGRILFRTAEQYNRCVSARQRRSSEADCPDAWETRTLALASEDRG